MVNESDNTETQKKWWHNCLIARIYRFVRYNKCRKLTVRAFFLSAYYRLCILLVKPKKLHKRWGLEGEETDREGIAPWQYRYSYWVSYAVDHVCSRTAWESKCLVRALTAQRLLKTKGIPSTMYLGCKMGEGKMLAHAWLRVGEMYVTGGNGEEYSIVDRFKA